MSMLLLATTELDEMGCMLQVENTQLHEVLQNIMSMVR